MQSKAAGKGPWDMKFIHCADIHLDTPLQGLAQYPGAPVNEIRNATRRAFERVLDAAISECVDFLIIAGDLYDTGLKSFESALFFNKQMARLADASIDVYLIYGNHDAASKLIKQLRPPRNVHVFRSSESQSLEKNGVVAGFGDFLGMIEAGTIALLGVFAGSGR